MSWLASLFGRQPVPAGPAPRAGAATRQPASGTSRPTRRTASAAPDTGPSTVPRELEEALSSGALVDHIRDLPDFERVLTTGEDAVYVLPASAAHLVCALDLGAKRAVVVACAAPHDQAVEQGQQIKVLRAKLREAGFAISGFKAATPGVIRALREGQAEATRANSNSAKGGPLDLFNRWIDVAERFGATDIHIEMRGTTAMVRIRVDGLLEPLEDGSGGRYACRQAEDAVAAGFNATRKGNSGPHYEADKFVDCMIGFNTARASGQLRFQNLRGRLGPKVVIRLLRSERGDQ